MPTFTGFGVAATGSEIVAAALVEIGALAQGESASPGDLAFGLQKLQRLIDTWNAMREIIFSHTFTLYTLIPNHAPHTIGPAAADFAANYRPVVIASASFILNGGSANPVDLPVQIRDAAWWAANPLKSLQSSVVTDLYYDPALPNGNLNFYPISNVASPVRLETWNSLNQALTLNTSLGFAQGYWDAVINNLAVSMGPGMEREPSPTLSRLAEQGLRIIFANNDAPPRIDTNSGMPGTVRDGRPDFNFLTGMRE